MSLSLLLRPLLAGSTGKERLTQICQIHGRKRNSGTAVPLLRLLKTPAAGRANSLVTSHHQQPLVSLATNERRTEGSHPPSKPGTYISWLTPEALRGYLLASICCGSRGPIYTHLLLHGDAPVRAAGARVTPLPLATAPRK